MHLIRASIIIIVITVSENAVASTEDIIASNNQASVQSISTRVDYTENYNGTLGTPRSGTADTETGKVHGHALYISTMWGQNLNYVEAEYSRNSGYTNYIGSYQGGTYGNVMQPDGATLTDYNIRYGRGFAFDDKSTSSYDEAMLTPYFELGHHMWDRSINSGETYTNDYLGIGALGQLSTINKLVITVNALVGYTLKSNISVAGPYGFSGALGNSVLYKSGLSIDYAFTKNFHGNCGVDYTYFEYRMSGLHSLGGGYYTWEPDSSTSYVTYKIGVGYAF